MATIEAGPVLARLKELGHDYNPERQAYKASIAHLRCTLYHPTSIAGDGGAAPTDVKASEVDQYVAKGFTVKRPPMPMDAGRVKTVRGARG